MLVWLSSEPQGPICTLLPSTGLPTVHTIMQIFFPPHKTKHQFWDLNAGSQPEKQAPPPVLDISPFAYFLDGKLSSAC